MKRPETSKETQLRVLSKTFDTKARKAARDGDTFRAERFRRLAAQFGRRASRAEVLNATKS